MGRHANGAVTGDPIGSAFGDGGALAGRLPGFTVRPEQTAMAAEVAGALDAGEHLVVEAGTGVGKSLGYLLPAARWAIDRGETVVVATYTKALQEQLVRKDLPVVRDVLAAAGKEFRFALLMGSENYLCLQRLHRWTNGGDDLFETPRPLDALRRIEAWSRDADTGLRTEIPERLPDDVWGRIARDPDLCLGPRGPFREACLYRKDLERAREAHLVVVNQHLFFAGMPLRKFGAVIVDEAHNLERVASQYLGIRVGSRRVKRLLDDIHNPQGRRGLARRLAKRSPTWFAEMDTCAGRTRDAARGFFDDVAFLLLEDEGTNDFGTLRINTPEVVDDTLSPAIETFRELLLRILPRLESDEESAEVEGAAKRCTGLVAETRAWLEQKDDASAYWIERRRGRTGEDVALAAAPLDLAEALRDRLFEPVRSVTLCSATLSVARSFAPFRERVGLSESRERLLDSPFDYARQAALFIDPAMPDPGADPEAFVDGVVERCAAIVPWVPGGVFILFTSWRLLHSVHDRLQGRLSDRPVFRQGERPPYELLRAFREAGDGVLLGTSTFWQGVDVPGAALSCVILTRLPFEPPATPLEEARAEWYAKQGRDVFREYALPQAVIRFRQGFGRLIRSADDRGAVCVLDPRIATRPYGRLFLKSIPPARRVESLEELAGFFG